MALISEFTHPSWYGYELCKKGSIASKQDFPKCPSALHNFLHSYDPARGIQIKLRKYTRSILKSTTSTSRVTGSIFRVTSSNSRVTSLNPELWFQIHELWVRIHELRVQIHEFRVQIHIHKFKNNLIKTHCSKFSYIRVFCPKNSTIDFTKTFITRNGWL